MRQQHSYYQLQFAMEPESQLVRVNRTDLDEIVDQLDTVQAENTLLRTQLAESPRDVTLLGKHPIINRPAWIAFLAFVSLSDPDQSNSYRALFQLGSDLTEEVLLAPPELKHITAMIYNTFGPNGVTLRHYKCAELPDLKRHSGRSMLQEQVYQPVDNIPLFVEVLHFVSVSASDMSECSQIASWSEMDPLTSMLSLLQSSDIPTTSISGEPSKSSQVDRPLREQMSKEPHGTTVRRGRSSQLYTVRRRPKV